MTPMPPARIPLHGRVWTSPAVGVVVLDPIPERPRVPKPLGPLAGETIWYEDPTGKHVHRELVLAGMEQARQSGKRIGRPRVIDEPGFEAKFGEVVELIKTGKPSRRKVARELEIGYATLKRLLEARGLAGPGDVAIAALKEVEKKHPGLEHVFINVGVGTHKKVFLEQLERFAREVMPVFTGAIRATLI